jgi:hypothetical protein
MSEACPGYFSSGVDSIVRVGRNIFIKGLKLLYLKYIIFCPWGIAHKKEGGGRKSYYN